MEIDLYIQREPEVSASEWYSAISTTDGIRQAQRGAVLTDHTTGEKMHFSANPCDIEIWNGREWVKVVDYDCRGGGEIVATARVMELPLEGRVGIMNFCKAIGAVVVDAAGNQYDLSS